ncbi:DUF2155 domain-containing protein [Roseomonas elaeocarpi]|uniref:DUF2155 domain-containing protein n=1 Tax=Roseomonas elaeocarpi TaxID=907779 RepID=A0ABV6JUE0_9PROT
MKRALLFSLLLLAVPAAAQDTQPAPPQDTQWIPMRNAKLQALDKVTARVTVLETPVNKPVQFGTLTVTVKACDARPPDEVPDAAAYLEVADKLAKPGTPLAFHGWMLANAPAVNMLEHPVYDLRILECK